MILDFSTLRSIIARRGGLDATRDKTLLDQAINLALRDICNSAEWYWRDSSYSFVIDPYNEVTATSTENSRTISISGYTLSSSDVGRYFKFDEEDIGYEIVAISGSNITVRNPYVDDSKSSKKGKIFTALYKMPPDCFEVYRASIDNSKWRKVLGSEDFLVRYGPLRNAIGNPVLLANSAMEDSPRTYSTGTVSGTINTNTLTGVGTEALDNIKPGTEITVDSNIYTSKYISSDTSIYLWQKLQSTIALGTTYSASSISHVILRPYPIGNEDSHKATVNYQRAIPDLLNDSDVPIIPYSKQGIIIERVLIDIFSGETQSVRLKTAYELYQNYLKALKRDNASYKKRVGAWVWEE